MSNSTFSQTATRLDSYNFMFSGLFTTNIFDFSVYQAGTLKYTIKDHVAITYKSGLYKIYQILMN